MRRTDVWVHAALAFAIASAMLVVSGCTEGGTTPPATSEVTSSPSASASASPTEDAALELEPGGTADDNLPYFDAVNSSFLAANAMPGGRAIIDNLVSAGFDKATMQVTQDATTIGSGADAVQFSVRFGDRCLVGQTSSGAGYVGTVGPVADGTNCLIGVTRVIDW